MAALLRQLDQAELESFVAYALETALRKLTSQAALKSQYPDSEFLESELCSERWRPVSGYPDYAVSKLGRVRNVSSGKMMVLSSIQRGYRQVGLIEKGRKRKFLAHCLVASAFLPNPRLKAHVNHKDGNKANNRLANLEWTTVTENNEHATVAGLRPHGKQHPMAIRASESGALLARAKRILQTGIATNSVSKSGTKFLLIEARVRKDRRAGS